MNIKSFIKNIKESIQTTSGPFNAAKKIFWLYGVFGKSSEKKTLIHFKFPSPVGNIRLNVRYNSGSDAFIVSEVFQEQCYFIPPNNPIATVLDLGANAGFTAVYFSRLFPDAQIACVEPMANNIAILKENLALNKVNPIVFEGAVAVEDGEVTMESGDKDYGNKVHGIPFGKSFDNNTTVVPGYTVTHIMKDLNWKRIDLLKIDIEGYEGVLLKENNSWLAKVDTLIMEIHEGVTIEFIKSITDAYGFAYSKLQMGNWILSRKEII
jgi:FkbM family methyltransferase